MKFKELFEINLSFDDIVITKISSYSEYDKYPKRLALNYTKKELEKRVNEIERVRNRDLNRLQNAPVDSQRQAHARNVVNTNYDEIINLKYALQIYKDFPMYTKEFKILQKYKRSPKTVKRDINKEVENERVKLNSNKLKKYMDDAYKWGQEAFLNPDTKTGGGYNHKKMSKLALELVIKKISFKDTDKIVKAFQRGHYSASEKHLKNIGFYK